MWWIPNGEIGGTAMDELLREAKAQKALGENACSLDTEAVLG
jgi:hypothetical protein